MDIIGIFKKSDEGFMNAIEYRKDEGYVRKKFSGSFLENCYSDLQMCFLALTLGVKPKSGRDRQNTEARELKSLYERGFSVPKLKKEGKGHLDIEYVEMENLSRLLRGGKTEYSKKIDYLEKAAKEMRKIHDAGFKRCDGATSNMGIKPDGSVLFFDFEHEFRGWNNKKDYSALAASAAFEIDKPENVGGALKSIAKGYGKDLTQNIGIVPHAYLFFFLGGKMKNLHELKKAIRYGIKK